MIPARVRCFSDSSGRSQSQLCPLKLASVGFEGGAALVLLEMLLLLLMLFLCIPWSSAVLIYVGLVEAISHSGGSED